MIEEPLDTLHVSDCPRRCGLLDHGISPDKANRIGWSRSRMDATKFHCLPLMRLRGACRKGRRRWLYTSSIAAVAWRRCRLATCACDNDDSPRPARDQRTSTLIALVMVGAAAAISDSSALLGAFFPRLRPLRSSAIVSMVVLFTGVGMIPLIQRLRTPTRTFGQAISRLSIARHPFQN